MPDGGTMIVAIGVLAAAVSAWCAWKGLTSARTANKAAVDANTKSDDANRIATEANDLVRESNLILRRGVDAELEERRLARQAKVVFKGLGTVRHGGMIASLQPRLFNEGPNTARDVVVSYTSPAGNVVTTPPQTIPPDDERMPLLGITRGDFGNELDHDVIFRVEWREGDDRRELEVSRRLRDG